MNEFILVVKRSVLKLQCCWKKFWSVWNKKLTNLNKKRKRSKNKKCLNTIQSFIKHKKFWLKCLFFIHQKFTSVATYFLLNFNVIQKNYIKLPFIHFCKHLWKLISVLWRLLALLYIYFLSAFKRHIVKLLIHKLF